MSKAAVKCLDLNESRKAYDLYGKVLRTVNKGKDVKVKLLKDGELGVYEVDVKKAE